MSKKDRENGDFVVDEGLRSEFAWLESAYRKIVDRFDRADLGETRTLYDFMDSTLDDAFSKYAEEHSPEGTVRLLPASYYSVNAVDDAVDDGRGSTSAEAGGAAGPAVLDGHALGEGGS